ncbi:MAG: PepSY domain-containing protein [Chloroflexi bacterium]|nr:PepSY domain-containing protein [Chloroflexota bacterium]
MRKSTLFISAMLTMFLMATLFGVVSAYQQIVRNKEAQAAKAASEPVVVDVVPTATLPPIAQVVVISPEQATTLAMDFIGDTNVYSVESVSYEGALAYLVTFSSGDLVYVSPTGEILANAKLEPVVVVAASGGGNGGNGGQSGNPGRNSGGSDDDDDEDHDDDDDDDD